MSISRWMDNGQSLNSPVFYFAWSSLMLKHFSGFCLSLIIIFSSMICFVLFNIYLCSISPFVHALCSWPQWAPFWKLFSILFQVYISDYYFSLEKEMATHSSTLAWKIPWTEGPGGLQSIESLGVGHDWETSLYFLTFMRWRRKWQPTPVFLPGESQGRGSLVSCRLWGHTESDTTKAT